VKQSDLQLSQPLLWLIFTVISLEIPVYLSMDMFLPALLQLQFSFALTLPQLQWSMFSWQLGANATALWVGPWSEQIGRRPVLLLGAALFFIASLCCTIAPAFGWFLLGRFLQGCTLGCVLVAGYSAINESLNQAMAIRVGTWLSTITLLSPLLGPLIGTILMSVGGWRLIFAVLSAMALLPLFAVLSFCPETLPQSQCQRFSPRQVWAQYRLLWAEWSFCGHVLALSLTLSAVVLLILEMPIIMMSEYQCDPWWYGAVMCYVFSQYIAGTVIVRRWVLYYAVQPLLFRGLQLTILTACCTILATFQSQLWVIVVALGLLFVSLAVVVGPLYRLTLESSQQPMGYRMSSCSFAISFMIGVQMVVLSVLIPQTLVNDLCLIAVGAGVAWFSLWQLYGSGDHRTVAV